MKRTILNNLIAAAAIISTLFTTNVEATAADFSPAASLKEAELVAKETYNFIAYKSPRNYGKKIAKENRLDRLNQINKEVSRLEATYAIELPRVNILHMTDTNRGFYNYTRDEIVFSTNKLEHTLRHEFAHVIDRRYNITNGEWRNLVQQMKEKGFSPSNYANTNLEEYWAEAFAYFTAPGYGTTVKRFPAELESFIHNVIVQLQSPAMVASN